ncbi:MAG: hypothetical protein NT040_08925 [Bacteroidetes bacterium]|nr:hypothetical protein [Bacteroidota bacterium]
MIRPKHIFLRLLLVLVPLLMAMAPAMAQNTVYKGNTTDLSVVPVPGDTYVWELYKDVGGVNFVTDPGNCPVAEAYFVGGINTGPAITVMWTTPGTYFFKVTATGGTCSNNLKVGKMIVLDELPTATFVQPDPICAGNSTNLTVLLTGTAPWSITYTTDGINPVTIPVIGASPYFISVNPLVNTTYQIISVTDSHGTNSVPSPAVTLIVKPIPVTNPIWHN